MDHITIICSSDKSVGFYIQLGFEVKSREDRGYDQLIYMGDGFSTLEIYMDGMHPERVKNSEALGLRHLRFHVEKLEEFSRKWKTKIKEDKRVKFIFVNDLDCLPIEIRERVPKTTEEE